MRVRLKADGRLVEILADGSERALPPNESVATIPLSGSVSRAAAVPAGVADREGAAAAMALYSRTLRGRSKLTQAEFAARIGVPIETVRNWEQGKRSPRGPARALLKVIEKAPEVVFAALAGNTGSNPVPR